ncbi:AI-2E family transporter [Rhodoferax sp. U11-2br]|uniref:AI-2E family transporter n=1 Tax=Rhodoferax sp. U11-2br TaxID=2838878 RepID=UPI001BE7DD35|nr:AI-2E family transporter [Rhodoferax sp. U11-2br]MBT3067527.1 AI-2E family transporter [Rhodoferax sp. U11-2br]
MHPEPTPLTPRDNKRALPTLLLLVSAALMLILLPFYGALMWGVIIALLFTPLFVWLLPRVGQRPSVAALLTMLVVLVIVVLPLALIAASLVQEAALVYSQLQSGELDPALYFRGLFNALPNWATSVLDRFGLVSFNTLQRRLTATLTQGAQVIATQTFSIGQNTFEFVASVFITLYLAYFLIRDGQSVSVALRRALPLAPEHKTVLLDTFSTVVRATVKGNLLVAAIQGALGGLGFWALGVSAAVLWAVLMAFLSLLPSVGAALVWAPVAVYFLLVGELGKSVALVAYGMLVIGLVDNLLRPMLVGKDTRLPDYVVMITTLGGMAVFGINGFVLGPVIAAMAMATWQIHISNQNSTLPES